MTVSCRQKKIIIADKRPDVLAHEARLLCEAEDMRIVARCADLQDLYQAIVAYPGSIVLLSTAMQPELVRLRILLEVTGSHALAIADHTQELETYVREGMNAEVRPDVSRARLADSVRRLAGCELSQPLRLMNNDAQVNKTLCQPSKVHNLQMLSRFAVRGPAFI